MPCLFLLQAVKYKLNLVLCYNLCNLVTFEPNKEKPRSINAAGSFSYIV
ncbi:hypothetical protein MuYL_0169 [Mucilaginibacter xinganensis]|uniref:Uncharacterized protein n=1 Tax=Mucilaginibacter xinganensis TaxID=1234841 RepID=A0A223NQ91_9SPHI|nr:hypothetical protein MuYL_0169 [Mucilaginibacter xinganensis]